MFFGGSGGFSEEQLDSISNAPDSAIVTIRFIMWIPPMGSYVVTVGG